MSAELPASTSPPRRRRWITPLVLVVLTVLVIVVVQSLTDVDRNIRAWITSAAVLLGLVGQLIWLLLFSGLRWWKRLAWLGVIVALGVGIRLATRVEGAISGLGLPKLVWRWTPTAEQRLAKAVSTGDLTATNSAAAAEAKFRFPQFLGPNRDGQVNDVKLARDWSARPPKELWRRPVGLGWSGFVVADGFAVTQEQRDEDERVTAYALRTEQPVWAHTNHTRFREWQGGDGPRATPTIVGDRVYAFGATGVLDCLELATGRLVWTVDVLVTNKLENLKWGKSSSPLVADGRVVVTGGELEVRSLLAYDATNGKLLWAATGDPASYASPALATLAGRPQILVIGKRTVAGHDPATGKQLWDFAWGSDGPPKGAQPLAVGSDRVFLSAGYGMGCLLIEVKAQPDGSLAATEVWRTKTMKTQFNNVAVRDGHLYGLDDGFLACVELTSGKRKWKDGRYGSGQSLLVGDLVLVQAEHGFVALAEAKPEGFSELGRISALSSKTWNNPALAGPYLLVRNDQEAVCYELPLAE